MRISDWSSDVCSSDLAADHALRRVEEPGPARPADPAPRALSSGGSAQDARQSTTGDPARTGICLPPRAQGSRTGNRSVPRRAAFGPFDPHPDAHRGHASRSEEHTSELQSLMRISYAVFCLKKKKTIRINHREI